MAYLKGFVDEDGNMRESEYFFEEIPSGHHLEYTRTRCVCIFVNDI